MSVSGTESDIPRFFVGGEDCEDFLERFRPEFDSFYEHDDDDEYDSVCTVFYHL